MEGSIVLARWRQCAPHLVYSNQHSHHNGPATCRVASSISTTGHVRAYPGLATFPPQNCPSCVGIWTPSNTFPRAHPSQYLDKFSRFCTAHSRVPYFTMSRPFSPQKSKLPLCMGDLDPVSKRWFLGPTRDHVPNGILIGSAVTAGLTIMTD